MPHNLLDQFITLCDLIGYMNKKIGSALQATEIGKTIRLARISKGYTQPELARLCGWESQSRISMYERGERSPRIHDLNHIAKALRISITEIIDACVTGKAPPVVNTNQLAIPLSNLNVSAGNGLLADNEFTYDKLIVDKEWFYEVTGIKPHDKLKMITVSGDSMLNTFADGDIAVVDFNKTEPVNGIFVIRDDNEQIVIKRLDFRGKKITLKSDNKAYDDRTLAANKITIIGRVRFRWQGKKV